jgi:protein-L-isoaspartate(D-aspartate) O-methyltransferase
LSQSPDEATTLRDALVDDLVASGQINDHHVEAAFRAVPRHVFLPQFPIESVYKDQGFEIKASGGITLSTSTGPSAMAYMLEHLNVGSGDRVLEIGTATGYNAALIAHIVGEDGLVVTLDIDDDLVEDACDHLSNAEYDQVKAFCADGGYGYSDYAPYDRIIVTTSAWELLPAWVEQLKPGGRIVAPLAIRAGRQVIVALENKIGHLVSESATPMGSGFITLRGAFRGPIQELLIGPSQNIYLTADELATEPDALYELLAGPSIDHRSGVQVTMRELYSLRFWIAATEPTICQLGEGDGSPNGGLVPRFQEDLNADKRFYWTEGLAAQNGLALFHRDPDQALPFELYVRSYGDASASNRLLQRIADWDAAGRPTGQSLHVKVYPMDTSYAPTGREMVVPKHHTKLVLKWE